MLSRTWLLVMVGALLGVIAGAAAGWHYGFNLAADRRRQLPNGSVNCKPGPWGELSYTPFTIGAPDDLIPVRTLEERGTHWFFKGYTSDAFITLLQGTGMSIDMQHAFLEPGVFHVQPDGVTITPTADLLYNLPDDARRTLYLTVAQFTENETELHYIQKDYFKYQFLGNDLSRESMAMFYRFAIVRGDYYVLSGLSGILARIPSYEEKLRFVKDLTRQRTMLLRLHVTPQTDVTTLAKYWGKGCWDTDVQTIMQSLTAIPTGTWMSILMVLPPLPTGELYSYPNLNGNPLAGVSVNRDCHWSSLNFFRDKPDDNFGRAEFVFRELKDNYFLTPGDPRYGDVLLFSKPDGTIIHSAVYIADDICFTKNGGTVIHPWMLSTISDLVAQYTCMIPPEQNLTLTYYRAKRL